jgi:chemotaxis protein CheC
MQDVSPVLTNKDLERLATAFHGGADEASSALARWLNAPTQITVDSVDQCPLTEVASLLGNPDSVVCVCLMEMVGTLRGYMLLSFDDANGLALADLVLARAVGSATAWGEVEVSCVTETMNIAGSAYLNGLAAKLSAMCQSAVELLPTSPLFLRDFSESLLETAFLEQTMEKSQAVFARSRFEHAGQAFGWTFLLIPSPDSLRQLSQWLAASP